MEIDADKVRVEHEARVSKVAEEQLFYLTSRGLTEDDARLLIVNGFMEHSPRTPAGIRGGIKSVDSA